MFDIERNQTLLVPPVKDADQFNIKACQWSGDSKLAACTGDLEVFDDELGDMRSRASCVHIVFDTQLGSSFDLHRSGSFPASVAFSTDNRRVSISKGHELRIFDLDSREEVALHEISDKIGKGNSAWSRGIEVVWLPGDRHLLCHSSQIGIVVMEAAAGKIIHHYEGRNAKVGELPVSPDGRHFARFA